MKPADGGIIESIEFKLPVIAETQKRLSRKLVEVEIDLNDVKTVGAVDVSYRGDAARAGFVLCSFPDCDILKRGVVTTKVEVPYIPTFFFLRETKPILMLALRWCERPSVLLVEGHGKAHPRGYGLASHVGLVLSVPTIGVAKKPLLGSPEGSSVKVGKAYVSVGNLVNLKSAVRIVEALLDKGYPKPLRIADELSKRWEDG